MKQDSTSTVRITGCTTINACVALQALMAFLGHVSAEINLRYAHLFDTTVRAEYEPALDLAKGSLQNQGAASRQQSQLGPTGHRHSSPKPEVPVYEPSWLSFNSWWTRRSTHSSVCRFSWNNR